MKGMTLVSTAATRRVPPLRFRRSVTLVLLFAAVFVTVLSSCGRSEEEQRRVSREERDRLAEEERQALKIAVSPTLDCLPLFVAKEKGMFGAAGQDIRLKCFTAHMDCDTAITGGSVEGMVSDLVRTEWLKRDKKLELQYVAATDAEWQLLSSRKARIKRTEQLGDKMVAMTRLSATDALTSMAVSGVRMKSQVYRIQVNDVHVRLSMLTGNEVDAAWFQEPLATAARLKGGTVMTDSKRLKFAPGVIAFRSEVSKDKRRKAQLDAFVTVYNAACDSLNKNGLSPYADIISKYCHVDGKVVKAIKPVRFSRTAAPKDKDISAARSALERLAE